jgi:hypothetical protein
MLRTVECYQHPIIQATQRLQPAALIQIPHDLCENQVEMIRRGAVQHLTDMIVTRHHRHAEQRLAVRSPSPFF